MSKARIEVRPGVARRGMARRGLAWLGVSKARSEAWQGRARLGASEA